MCVDALWGGQSHLWTLSSPTMQQCTSDTDTGILEAVRPKQEANDTEIKNVLFLRKAVTSHSTPKMLRIDKYQKYHNCVLARQAKGR